VDACEAKWQRYRGLDGGGAGEADEAEKMCGGGGSRSGGGDKGGGEGSGEGAGGGQGGVDAVAELCGKIAAEEAAIGEQVAVATGLRVSLFVLP
jgi:hypothetical protein